jgi:hypothetical protein
LGESVRGAVLVLAEGRGVTAMLKSHEAYRQANVDAARIVAADAARFGGPEAALVRWARLVLDRAAGPQARNVDGGSFGGSQLDGESTDGLT